MYVSGLLQASALDVVTQPGWRTHLRSVRLQLRARRDLLLTGLCERAPAAHIETVPMGGLNLWVQLPEDVEVGRLVGECELRGLIIAPGTEWFAAEPSGPFVRMNYAGENPERFDDAARIFAEALDASH